MSSATSVSRSDRSNASRNHSCGSGWACALGIAAGVGAAAPAPSISARLVSRAAPAALRGAGAATSSVNSGRSFKMPSDSSSAMLAASANTTMPMTAVTAYDEAPIAPSTMISTRPASRDSTRDAQANPYTAYTSVVVWRATSCSVIHSTPSMSVSAMLTVAMASPVKCPGNTDRISMPAATSMISMRQRNEKLSRLRFTMNHQMMNRLITTTPIWWTTRCNASMGTGSPAGKPREMPSANPNTARPPKMNSMVLRGSLS